MKTEKWYTRRLAEYCDRHYSEYEDEIGFFPNPAQNKWRFDIPSLKERVELTCDDNGVVTETVVKTQS